MNIPLPKIHVTEIRRDGDEYKETPACINVEGIAMIRDNELTSSGPHIIGKTKPTHCTTILLTTGHEVHVKESQAEVEAMEAKVVEERLARVTVHPASC